jgi:hypothetical protein
MTVFIISLLSEEENISNDDNNEYETDLTAPTCSKRCVYSKIEMLNLAMLQPDYIQVKGTRMPPSNANLFMENFLNSEDSKPDLWP